MRKKLIILFILVSVITIIYFVYKVSTFSMFDVEISQVVEIGVPHKPYKIGVFYLPSNASSQSYIQIRQIGNEEVLQNYERYRAC